MRPSQICGCPFREPRVFTIAHIFYLYVIFCGPGFVSIPSNQSRVHSFPHKPFWHTCMAYIPVVPHKAVAEVSKMENL